MAKTNAITEPTFLAFFNRISEFKACIERHAPSAVDPADWTHLGYSPALIADWERRHAELRHLAETVAVDDLESHGFQFDPSSDGHQKYAKRQAALNMCGFLPSADVKPVKIAEYGDQDHKFTRGIVVNSIIGTFVAFGDGSRVATAKILNYGLPKGCPSAVTNFEVRNAQDAFVKTMVRATMCRGIFGDSAQICLEAALTVLGIEARTAHILWGDMGGTSDKRGDRPHAELTSAMVDGTIFERYDRAARRVRWRKPSPGCTAGILKQQLKYLQGLLRIKLASAKSLPEVVAGNAAPAVGT